MTKRHTVTVEEMRDFLDTISVTMASSSREKKRLSVHIWDDDITKRSFVVEGPDVKSTYEEIGEAVHEYNNL